MPCVSPQMRLVMLDAIVMTAKPLSATLVRANVIFFACVYSVVTRQMATSGETLDADLAHVAAPLFYRRSRALTVSGTQCGSSCACVRRHTRGLPLQHSRRHRSHGRCSRNARKHNWWWGYSRSGRRRRERRTCGASSGLGPVLRQ